MKILIVEDESLAVSRLQWLLDKIQADYELVGVAHSIREALVLIEKNKIDLGFFDIQIEDGLSLSIFEQTNVGFPVIFTTAFNDYAVKAFKLNSIDYLLKPISEPELKHALNKFNTLWNNPNSLISNSLIDEMRQILMGKYKERFAVRTGTKTEIIQSDNICFFYSLNKGSFVKTSQDKNYLLDGSLDHIFPLLNPRRFFKISRRHIVNLDAIQDIQAYSATRLKVNMKVKTDEELIVSREKVSAFKKWIESS
ncbi:MAG: DNA-binding response regulator [Bacteroidetes bacterium CG18_big_fil_WC_8_21_14_2_50_41_14]|nr:MAG: DNA-binding response regulator [Bacteroidetes bacterium CG18_big_fil_WC_8_21_14_2_50_41_14]PJB54980.1 MAG: DNA-binding response regulator [Bacteroidetes bacterium CG_4_9_14_3_um_filter_41_19]